jgi:hypothetical protein
VRELALIANVVTSARSALASSAPFASRVFALLHLVGVGFGVGSALLGAGLGIGFAQRRAGHRVS